MTFPTLGAPGFTKLLFEESEKIFKARWAFESEASKMATFIIDHIKKKRQALGIEKKKERVLYDMEMRRQLEF